MREIIRLFSILCVFALGATIFADERDYGAFVDAAMASDYDEAGGLALIKKASSDTHAGLVKGIVCHNIAMNGLEKYVRESKLALEPLLADPLAMGYYGSVLTLESGFASNRKDLAGAVTLLQEGFKWIDKSVDAAPGMVALRILRVSNGLGVSKASPYKRYDVMKADIDFLIAKAPTLSPATQATIYFLAGEYALAMKKTQTAIEMYDKAARAAPESGAGKQAAKKLALLEG